MIRKEMSDGRGGTRILEPTEPEYWEGPWRYEPYPKWLFKAVLGSAPETKLVKNEDERAKLGSGWAETPDEAQVYLDAYEADIARAAAERLADDAKMSARAQAEALAIDRSTDALLPEIRETPRRGRPRKIAPTS